MLEVIRGSWWLVLEHSNGYFSLKIMWGKGSWALELLFRQGLDLEVEEQLCRHQMCSVHLAVLCGHLCLLWTLVAPKPGSGNPVLRLSQGKAAQLSAKQPASLLECWHQFAIL